MISYPSTDAWKEIPGWTCHRLRQWYDEVALTISPGGTFVEIGVAYGASLAYLGARVHESVRMVGVDIFEEHQGRAQLDDATWRRVLSHGDPLAACVGELARSASYMLGRLTLIRRTGERAAELMRRDSVDVVFIDEHHTYESVSACIKAWLPNVRAGGYLSGHDCNPNYPGVEKAVREHLPGAEFRAPHPDDNGWGGVWTWRKPTT